jgi:aspartate-semialdehyde dehydrogenase
LPTAPEKPIVVFEDPLRPQPVLDVNKGNGMSVSVGRIKLKGSTLTFTVLSHNTIRGAAGGSVLNAELAYVKGLI